MRIALRAAANNPGFTALVVLSLAAGIGLTAALASVADAILFRPLPVARPAEIVRVFASSTGQTPGFVSYPDFEDVRAASRTLAAAVAQSQILIAVGGESGASPRVRMGLAVTADYFDVLGVPPAFGRTFRASDWKEPVVVLGYGFWESAFGADRKIIGHVIRVGGAAFTVIGVARKGFGLDRFLREDFYVPMGVYGVKLLPSSGRPLEDRAKRCLSVYGRLAHGATVEQARAEFTALAARLENLDHVVLTEFQARMRADRTMPLMAGLALAVGVLMLAIACANVTGLLLMRGEARTCETAIRMAMGANHARLLAESVTGSLMLAASGGALAIPVAWAVTRMIAKSAEIPADLPFSLAVGIDGRVIALGLGVTALAAIVCTLATWLATSRTEITVLLKAAAGGRTSVRSMLVAIEIALVAMLVASDGRMLSGIAAAAKIDLGYRTDHVLVMTLDPAQVRFAEIPARAFYQELLDGVRDLPGVKAAALAQSVPLGYSSAQREIEIEGQPPTHLTVWMNIVSPGYFDMMHIEIVEGIGFERRDTETSPPVMVVNQTLAKLLNGGSVRMNGRKIQVIGVVRTTKYFEPTEAPRPYFYLPYSQNYASRMVLHVETAGDPARAAQTVLHHIDSIQPVSEVRALRDYSTKGALLSARVAVQMLSIVSLGGLLLALAGLYTVVASAMERRRREIAIRIALGATRSSVVILMLRDGTKLVAIGTACGLAVSMGTSRFLASLAPGVGKPNAWVSTCTALLVVTASLTACLIPACRAARTDPAVSLREP